MSRASAAALPIRSRRMTSLVATINTVLVAACSAANATGPDARVNPAAVKAVGACPIDVVASRRPRLDPADLMVVAFQKTAEQTTASPCGLRANVRIDASGPGGGRK